VAVITSTTDAGPATATTEVIVARSLTKVYRGAARAVDELDLAIREGEVFGLLGPNGAGKTTTVGMLTTRIVPTGGEAFVAGIDVTASPALVKRSIGVVTQVNTLDRSLNVWENLYFHGRYFGMSARRARAEADEALERFRLTARATADVTTLSGGLARRLMLARAILHRPTVVFLDEPTAGLDPQSRLALWELIGQFRRDGLTVLLTTHYMEEADRICDRVAIFDRGRILALDTPGALKRTVGGTVLFLEAGADADRLVPVLTGVAGTSEVRRVDDGVWLRLNGTDGVLPAVLAASVEKGFRLTDVRVTEADLEAVVIRLTGSELRE